jgi:tyrosinase
LIYEEALQKECRYSGAQPFWDWTLDNPENNGAQFNASPIFDPVNGFGGNGYNGSVPLPPFPGGAFGPPLGSCLDNGPFAKLQVILDPGPPDADMQLTTSSGRCLKRNFQPDLASISLSWSNNVVPLLQKTPFSNFTYFFDHNAGNTSAAAGVHGGGHAGVGGEVSSTLGLVEAFMRSKF